MNQLPRELHDISYSEMISIAGGTYVQESDRGERFEHTISSFSIGKYQVTYELWYEVYQWAVNNGYSFANAGREGNYGKIGARPSFAKYEPVTTLNWRDCIVWCNAYSELCGKAPVYKYNGIILKDSTNAGFCDNATCDWSANGYRLPTEGEWQYAASDRGDTHCTYASGAPHNYENDDVCDEVAWYAANSGFRTHPVGRKTANGLGLYDMSGNVFEWCWDWYGAYLSSPDKDYHGATSGSDRIMRGGSWYDLANYLQVGFRGSRLSPDVGGSNSGFRLVCSGSTFASDVSAPSTMDSQSYAKSSSDMVGEETPDELRNVKYRDVVPVKGGTYTQESNKGGQFEHTISGFSIGKYQVTYELWYFVYHWAVEHAYYFVEKDRKGHKVRSNEEPSSDKHEPVTKISWQDCIVWCNAYSEMCGKTPVYKYNGSILKDSRNTEACDHATCDWSANGYRLPTEGEWQYAASNCGNTPCTYASGTTTNCDNLDACKAVAWYDLNAGDKTCAVGEKTANGLGLYDMSGNVWEWCWDWYGSYPSDHVTDHRGTSSGFRRVLRGGSCIDSANSLQVGYRYGINPYIRCHSIGFRLACSGGTHVYDKSSPSTVGLPSSGKDSHSSVELESSVNRSSSTVDLPSSGKDSRSPVELESSVSRSSSTVDTAGTVGTAIEDVPKHIQDVKYRDVVLVEGGTYVQESDEGEQFKHTISDFFIGKYQVTYELWYFVYHWAIGHGYKFKNAGTEGSNYVLGARPSLAKYEPVTTVNWRDCIVWCNAYSELCDKTPVYRYNGSILKDSTNAEACDNAACDWFADGYRLPTEGEWQYAASNRGSTPWTHAGGATTNCDNPDACGAVAWYRVNSFGKTHPVGEKTANGLGLHDMSGNVWEWCWDWWSGSHPSESVLDYRGASSGSRRVKRGGSWSSDTNSLQIGYHDRYSPQGGSGRLGFRLVCCDTIPVSDESSSSVVDSASLGSS